MPLPLQTFSSLTAQMAAAVQGTASQLLDLTIGSVLRALLEACASVALWMQWLILQVLAITRASTSNGLDLDTWMADFSLARLPGSSASGLVTFGRYTAGIATTIPIGSSIRTNDGLQTFTVVADVTNVNWDGSNGYSLAALGGSLTVPTLATVAGSAGNVQPGAVDLLGTTIPGIDFVVNALPFTGGVDAESDASLRSRFQLYINSRSLATSGAIAFAITSVRQGLRYVILENKDAMGLAAVGHFAVTVDDGSGAPSASLLAAIQAAVDSARPIGSTYSVAGPIAAAIAVTLTLHTNNAASKDAVGAAVSTAILDWIVQLSIGGTLAISMIEAIAHRTDLSVISVTSTLINGQPLDVVAPPTTVLVPTSVVVS